jgi:hypothetical protein
MRRDIDNKFGLSEGPHGAWFCACVHLLRVALGSDRPVSDLYMCEDTAELRWAVKQGADSHRIVRLTKLTDFYPGQWANKWHYLEQAKEGGGAPVRLAIHNPSE